MTDISRQLSFDLPARPALGRDDFFVSPANAVAVALIEHPGDWPEGKLALSGPAGSGKTHLVHVWAAATGAQILRAQDIAEPDIPNLARGDVAVEDVPDIANNPAAQRALFHLHNLLRAEGHRLLVTGRGSPSSWGLTLPDLQSRLLAAAHAALEDPDDALLAAVLAKLFADRQITPKREVIPFLVQRMDRSFSAALDIVERLDREALTKGRNLTRSLASECLGTGSSTD